MDTFIKNFISCKIKPETNLIIGCYPLLAQVNDELFKKNLLPSLQKAMLRNPEIILEGVGLILTGLNLDLSNYALEIGANLITNLHSKDDKARNESSEACKRLAEKIHSSKALEALLRKNFDVFHGSNGKLTVVEHKISVLQGAGNFSYNAIETNDQQTILQVVVDLFVKVLEIEVHEKTLCQALEMLNLWAVKFVDDLPKKLIDAFKNGMALKTSTPIVKIAYLQCMINVFNENNVKQALDLVAIFLKSLDKAVTQPTQVLSVTEGLNAVLLLIKLSEHGYDKENNFQNIWSVVFDMEKQIFVSDKFLISSTDESNK